MTSDPARTANLIGALALALTDRQEAAARAASGLGGSACAALVLVGFHPGSTIGTVAQVADVTHSVAVRLVEGLEKAGLLARASGDDDKRKVTLRLTPAGEARRRSILDAREAVLRDSLGAVPSPMAETLRIAVEAMLERLTLDRHSADHICRLCDEGVCPGETCPVECTAVRLAGLP